MNLFEWYLNLTFWQAVLVWLKLLLPVLFILTVCGLVGFSVKVFSGSLKLPSNIHSARGKKQPEKQTAQ